MFRSSFLAQSDTRANDQFSRQRSMFSFKSTAEMAAEAAAKSAPVGRLAHVATERATEKATEMSDSSSLPDFDNIDAEMSETKEKSETEEKNEVKPGQEAGYEANTIAGISLTLAKEGMLGEQMLEESRRAAPGSAYEEMLRVRATADAYEVSGSTLARMGAKKSDDEAKAKSDAEAEKNDAEAAKSESEKSDGAGDGDDEKECDEEESEEEDDQVQGKHEFQPKALHS